MARHRLTLSTLKFLSAVDFPAQPEALALLMKRAKRDDFAITARVIKTDPKLGLIFGWAWKSTIDGAEHFDLQGDAIGEDDATLKAACDFMLDAAPVDENHNGTSDGSRVVFAWPMTAELAKTFSIDTKDTGLMVGVKVSAAVMAKFVDGTYTGWSIAGTGERALVKGAWTTATIDDLPDNSFLYIEPGGKTDTDGKTTPRSLRHFPYKSASGVVDLPHLRDAATRIPQSSLPASLRDKLQMKAEKLIAAQHTEKRAPFSKSTMLTTATAGHTHLLDDEGGAEAGETSYATSSEGGDPYSYTPGHTHPWARTTDGTIVIGEAAGHVHECITQTALDAIVAADGEGDVDEDDQLAGKRAQGNRPTQGTTAKVVSQPEGTMNDADKIKKLEIENAALAKRADRADRIATFSDAHRAYLAKCALGDQDVFIAKSLTERDEVVKGAIAFTSKSGAVYYTSDDPRLVDLAKREDGHADELAKARSATADAEIEKRVISDIPALAGDKVAKVALLRAVETIGDKPQRDAVTALLKGANAAMVALGTPSGIGSDGEPVEGDAFKAFNDGRDAFAKKMNIANPLDAQGAFLKTDEGKTLKAAYDATRAYAQN